MIVSDWLPKIVADIQSLLAPGETEPLPDGHAVELVNLWDPEAGSVPAGVNYAHEANAPQTTDPADHLASSDDNPGTPI